MQEKVYYDFSIASAFGIYFELQHRLRVWLHDDCLLNYFREVS